METATESPSTRPPSAPVDPEALLGGRGFQAVGLVSLFLSAAFFFKLAADHGWLPPVARVIMGLIAGTGLLLSGVVMHRRENPNRAIIEGLLALGGALCYLSLWGAGPRFDLIPTAAAFGGMSAVTAILTFLAARHRSQITALYGLIGGLLTPALLPHGGEEQIILASYLLALCAGMLFLAQDARFRFLPSVAFLGSLVYVPQFIVKTHTSWSYLDNVAVASAFFLEFAIGLYVISRRKTAFEAIDAVLIALNIATYACILELNLTDHQTLLGSALLVLSAVLALGAYKMRTSESVHAIYTWSAAGALALACYAFLSGHVELYAALAAEGVGFFALGSYRSMPRIRIAAMISAIAAVVIGLLTIWLQTPAYAQLPERIGMFAGMALALFAIAAIAKAKPSAVFGRETDVPEAVMLVANVVVVTSIANVAYALPGIASGVTYSMGETTMSVAWTVYAAAIFAVAMIRKSALLRWTSLLLFVLTIGKVLIVDLAATELIERVGICFGLGVATLVISTFYLRRVQRA